MIEGERKMMYSKPKCTVEFTNVWLQETRSGWTGRAFEVCSSGAPTTATIPGRRTWGRNGRRLLRRTVAWDVHSWPSVFITGMRSTPLRECRDRWWKEARSTPGGSRWLMQKHTSHVSTERSVSSSCPSEGSLALPPSGGDLHLPCRWKEIPRVLPSASRSGARRASCPKIGRRWPSGSEAAEPGTWAAWKETL